jgi:hypothetical protein
MNPVKRNYKQRAPVAIPYGRQSIGQVYSPKSRVTLISPEEMEQLLNSRQEPEPLFQFHALAAMRS